MSALPARKLDPESEEDRASSRALRALQGVGARKKVNKSASQRVSESERGRAIPFLGGRQQAANDNAARSHESVGKGGTIKQSSNQTILPNVQRPTPRAHPRGAAGPQHVAPPISTAIQLHADQVRDRFQNEEGGMEETPAADLPIEGEPTFLESKVRSYALPEESGEELEQRRQGEMLRTAASAFAPEWSPAEEGPALSEEAPMEEVERETTRPARAGAGAPAEAASIQRQQLNMQAEIQAAQTQVRLETDRRQAETAVKSAAQNAEAAREQIHKLYQYGRLMIQLLTAETVVTFVSGIIDANILAIKQVVGSKLDFPPFYYKTSKPDVGLLMVVGSFDALFFAVGLFSMMLPVLIIIALASVKFDIFSVIYGMFSGLFS